MRLGSLFSGLGGFERAFERAGMTPAWQVEIDRDCNRVLEHHWPGVPKFDDVRTVGAAQLEPVDVISFGSPCQDLSVAGKRAGMAGERSGLFFEAIRIVRELRPAFAVWENVPGAFSSHAGRDFLSAVRAFHELGARDVAWRTLDARYWGVAQRRRRVFVVADFRGERAGQILFESEGCSRNPAAPGEAGAGLAPSVTPGARRACGDGSGRDQLTVSGCLTERQGRNGNANADRQAMVYQCHGSNVGPMGTVRSGNGHATGGVPFLAFGGNDTRGPLDVATAVNACGTASGRQDFESETFVVDAVAFHENQRHEITTSDTAGSLKVGGGKPGQGYPAVAFQERGREGGRNVETQAELAYSLNAPNGGGRRQEMNVNAGMTVRRLSPVECLRLQGLPDDFLDLDPPLSDSAKYRLIGNSVAVPVVEWLGRRIMTAARTA
jgi:DNA (cytosine-5)-methyltransferase 1